MKNRFSNRETLNFQQVGGFDPTGGVGGVKPSTGTNTARPIELSALEAIGRIVGEAADRNNLSTSGKLCTACHM
jgi:hypothetical protein